MNYTERRVHNEDAAVTTVVVDDDDDIDEDVWNYTERRAQTPNLCTFYNSDFLIYSSMGSFYIPCIVMTLLYWRIFHAIRQRARKSAAASALTHLPRQQQQQQQQRSAAKSSPTSPGGGVSGTAPASPRPAAGTERASLLPPPPPISANCARLAAHEASSGDDPALRQEQMPDVPETAGLNEGGTCDGDIYCATAADDTDLEPHGAPVEVNICRLDHVDTVGGARLGTGATYLAPSTVVIVERMLDDGVGASVPNASNAIHLTSAPPSPSTAVRNSERQPDMRRNGGRRGIEADRVQSKTFVTRFNFGLRRVRSAARRKKKSSGQPRVGGAHNAQKRERKATKTLAIVLGRYLTPCSTVKVKVMSICIALIHETYLRRSGIARIVKGYRSFTCTPCVSSASGMSHTCLCFPSRSWYSFTDPGGMEG